MMALLEMTNATIATPNRRVLFDGLNLRLGRERVALMGRNGVGKSTLLAVLAGHSDTQKGRALARGPVHYVPQLLQRETVRHDLERLSPSAHRHVAEEWENISPRPFADLLRSSAPSRGELRKLALLRAQWSNADVLLLDEPTEDLDDVGVAWLKTWLARWPGCLVAASHDRRLLEDFEHFFIASETGCRYFLGTLTTVEAELEREHEKVEDRYAGNLQRLVAHEKHVLHVERRKARKKRFGRCRELDRGTPRIQLNRKRELAQASHGRLAVLRQERLEALRQWSKSTRRALSVRLSLELPVPVLPASDGDVLALRDVSVQRGDRCLLTSIDLRVSRQRIGVIGPNGSGKTTLLEISAGAREPTSGLVSTQRSKIGVIEQCGANWLLDDSLLSLLSRESPGRSAGELAKVLVAHKFPLALGERSLRSLSPGERARAAVICLFRRSPPVEVLVLDEPTYSLDLVGQRAMTHALRAWPGGLVVASHDRAFLEMIGVDALITLGS